MRMLLISLIVLFILILCMLFFIFMYIEKNGIHAGSIEMTKDENGTNVWKFSFNKGFDYDKMAKYKFVTFKVIKRRNDEI